MAIRPLDQVAALFRRRRTRDTDRTFVVLHPPETPPPAEIFDQPTERVEVKPR